MTDERSEFATKLIAAGCDAYRARAFACAANQESIDHCDAILKLLDARTREREARQVEGTHSP